MRHRRWLPRAEEFRPRPLPGRASEPGPLSRTAWAMAQHPWTILLMALVTIGMGWGVVSCNSPSRTTAASVPLAPREHKLSLTREPEIRVRVRSGVAGMTLAGATRLGVVALGASGPTGPRVVMPAPLKVEATSTGVRVTDAKGQARDFPGPAGVQVAGESVEADASLRLRIDNTPYPGSVRIVPRTGRVERPSEMVVEAPRTDVPAADGSGGEPGSASVLAQAEPKKQPAPRAKATYKLDAIEHVPMETYLIGVVPSEMFADWPLLAYQVQAVCARTYALHERQRSMDLGLDFDVESDTKDQAYNGASTNPTASRAVESTRGVVLTWQGQIVRTYYSSTCGGRNASASDVFSTRPGYEFNRAKPIQAKTRDYACQSSKWFRWEVTRDRLQLSAQFRQWGQRNGHDVRSIGILDRIDVNKVNADGRPSQYRLTDEKGRTWDLSAESVRVACNVSVPGTPDVGSAKVRSGDVEFIVDGARVVIRGRGFGHGVGMCQYCAKAFADKGMDWKKQLELFYPGATLERAY